MPSVKELYSFGLKLSCRDLFFGPAEQAPDRIRRGIAIARLEIHALAGRGDLEAGRARPVDEFADQRRLIAIGHRIDQALGTRLFSQDRSDHDVGFDIDHDHMLVMLDGAKRMARAGNRMAGRFDDAFDLAAFEHCVDIVGHERRSALDGIAAAGGRIALFRPTDTAHGFLRLADIKIDDGDQVKTLDLLRLRHDHGSELSSADQAHPDGASIGGTQ